MHVERKDPKQKQKQVGERGGAIMLVCKDIISTRTHTAMYVAACLGTHLPCNAPSTLRSTYLCCTLVPCMQQHDSCTGDLQFSFVLGELLEVFEA